MVAKRTSTHGGPVRDQHPGKGIFDVLAPGDAAFFLERGAETANREYAILISFGTSAQDPISIA